eukprot:2815804-Prymnesium_polylepis.1
MSFFRRIRRLASPSSCLRRGSTMIHPHARLADSSAVDGSMCVPQPPPRCPNRECARCVTHRTRGEYKHPSTLRGSPEVREPESLRARSASHRVARRPSARSQTHAATRTHYGRLLYGGCVADQTPSLKNWPDLPS